LAYIDLEAKHEVAMNWHPLPHPPFLKCASFVFFSLLSYMLCHYDWNKDIIDGFKSSLTQYKKIESKKWDN
jgi:hypothetical protein